MTQPDPTPVTAAGGLDERAVLRRFSALSETGWLWVSDAELAVIQRALLAAATPKETDDDAH